MSTQFFRINWKLLNVTWESVNEIWNTGIIEGPKFAIRFGSVGTTQCTMRLQYTSSTKGVYLQLDVDSVDGMAEDFKMTLNAYLKCGNGFWKLENWIAVFGEGGEGEPPFQAYFLWDDFVKIRELMKRRIEGENVLDLHFVVSNKFFS
jgi:hypothetical protein